MDAVGSSTQCRPINVLGMVSVLVAHMTGLLVFPNNRRGSIACNLLVIVFMVVCRIVLDVDALTLAHEVMGMMAYTAATQVIHRPLFVMQTCADVIMLVFLLVPNVLVVLDETVIGFFHKNAWIEVHSLDRFALTMFYRKQHLFLHSALVVLLLSVGTTLSKRWRYSPRAQYVRSFVEPACLVAVAMILMTHDHMANLHPGVENIDPYNLTAFKIAQQHPCPPGTVPSPAKNGQCMPHPTMAHFPSHPVIGTLMCLSALAYLRSVHSHLAHSPVGTHIDLTSLIPATIDNGALRITRLTATYVLLLLAHFLYIDSVMEYLGCREALLKPNPEWWDLSRQYVRSALDRQADGLTNNTEISTYLCITVVAAACQLGAFVAAYMPDNLVLASTGLTPSAADLTEHDEEDALIKPPSEHASEDSA